MAVYVDDWRQRATLGPVVDGRWSHLVGDTEAELHEFATRLGLRRAWYQEHRRHPALNHYDVTEETRRAAVALGAVAITWREMARMLRARRLADPAASRAPSAPPERRDDGPIPHGQSSATNSAKASNCSR